jgi:hypothetical protein
LVILGYSSMAQAPLTSLLGQKLGYLEGHASRSRSRESDPRLMLSSQTGVPSVSTRQYSCAIPIPNQMNIGNGVYWRGDNSRGQLGFTGSGGPTPVFIQGSATFQSFSVGYDSACGIDTSQSDDTYCWGNNSSGQLGTGSSGGYSGSGYPATTAVAGHRFTVVSVGADYACGVDLPSGFVTYCWGANDMVQLGNGTNNPSSTPVQVMFP